MFSNDKVIKHFSFVDSCDNLSSSNLTQIFLHTQKYKFEIKLMILVPFLIILKIKVQEIEKLLILVYMKFNKFLMKLEDIEHTPKLSNYSPRRRKKLIHKLHSSKYFFSL